MLKFIPSKFNECKNKKNTFLNSSGQKHNNGRNMHLKELNGNLNYRDQLTFGSIHFTLTNGSGVKSLKLVALMC